MKTFRSTLTLRQTKKNKVIMNISSKNNEISVNMDAIIDGHKYKEKTKFVAGDLNNLTKKKGYKEMAHAFEHSKFKDEPYDIKMTIHDGNKKVFLLDIDSSDGPIQNVIHHYIKKLRQTSFL